MKREDLSNIMKKAHKLAREMEGDYQAKLALGLRIAWREYKHRKLFLKQTKFRSNGKVHSYKWALKYQGDHTYYCPDLDMTINVATGETSKNHYGRTIYLNELVKSSTGRRAWKYEIIEE